MKKWLMLAAAVVSEVTASLSLKGALDQPLWYILVAIGYTSAFIFISLAMRQGLGLGVAYGIWGAMGVALTAVLATVIFGEVLTPVMGIGLLLVMVGVLVVELGSQQAAKRQDKLEGSAA